MKIRLFCLLILFLPVFCFAQLKVNTKFNPNDTTLEVSFANNNQTGIIIIKNEQTMHDMGSYCKVHFLDNNGVILMEGWYNYVHENNPRRIIVLHPQKKDSFTLSFSMIKEEKKLRGLKKIKAYFWIKYSDEKKKEPQFLSFFKEFSVN
jgi:hypothetical protein